VFRPLSAKRAHKTLEIGHAAVYYGRVGRFLAYLTLGFFAAGTAHACTIVNQPAPREALKAAAVVFRGTVVTSSMLPLHPEMRGRQRFAVTLRVAEYWKGTVAEQ
jgi:hypothetical protein